ncbi:MAG TPA: hypothetical protein VF193_01095 [Steroidobacter sp.]|jgi:hypothetical protein
MNLLNTRSEYGLISRTRDGALDEPTNVKSVAKMVMAALVGAAVPGTRGSSTGS